MSVDFFPFTVKSYDNGHYVEKPWNYDTFVKYKPKDMSWYAYDVTVLSKDRGKITMYGILCSVYGGIGEKKHEFECDIDPKDLEQFITMRIDELACEQEQEEYDAARKARRIEIAKQIRESME